MVIERVVGGSEKLYHVSGYHHGVSGPLIPEVRGTDGEYRWYQTETRVLPFRDRERRAQLPVGLHAVIEEDPVHLNTLDK